MSTESQPSIVEDTMQNGRLTICCVIGNYKEAAPQYNVRHANLCALGLVVKRWTKADVTSTPKT
eukprot:4647877-Pyramimonas_sp.AAC.2